MRIEIKVPLPNYSEEALNQAVEQAPGKPFWDRTLEADKQEIGVVVSARRVESESAVLLIVEMF